MSYQISWGTGNTLVMPDQKDVVYGHLLNYLTANAREHSDIVDEMLNPDNGSLVVAYANLDDEEKEDFTDLLSDMVSEILMDEDVSIEFLKKDNEAWEQYLGGAKTADDEQLRELLTDYAEATTLYEIHVGSADYDRLRGRSGFKFGRDMQKLPKFNLSEFKGKYSLKPRIKPQPLQLEVSVSKKGATKTRGSFEDILAQADKDRKKLRRALNAKINKQSLKETLKEYNELVQERGQLRKVLDKEVLDEMKLRYEQGTVKSNLKKQVAKVVIDYMASFTENEATARLIDKSLSINYKIVNVNPIQYFYTVKGQMKGAMDSLSTLAQAQLDEKSKQIRDRGVVSGGWTSTTGSQIKFTNAMFERDEDDIEEEEDFKGTIYLEAQTVQGIPKDITQFTLSDMVPVSFLTDKNKEKETYFYELKTSTLIKQVESDKKLGAFLDFGIGDINKVVVNMVEIKFTLPPKSKKGTTIKEGAFSQEQQILAKRLSEIKVITNLKSAPIAIWDSSSYSPSAVKPSAKMEEHLALFKERIEDLIDYYEIKVKGEVDDKEEN